MTTHYQKIQALGNRMAENLTIMGVPSQFDEGGLTLADKILEISGRVTSGIILYGDKKIAQSEDTVNLYALLLEDNVAVSGETVRFYSDIPFTTTSITEGSIALGDDYWVSTSSTGNCWIGIGGSKGYIQFTSTTIQIYISSWSQTYYYTGKFHIKDEVLTYTDMNGETQTIDLTGVGTSYSYGATNPFTVEYFWEDAVTNSEGIATIDYDCTGSGLREFYTTSGTFVSKTYSILDTIAFDNATLSDHNDIWYTNNATITRGADNTVITATVQWGSIYLGNPTTRTQLNLLNNTDKICIEWIGSNVQGNNGFNIKYNDGSNRYISFITGTGFHKVILSKTRVDLYFDNVWKVGWDISTTNAYLQSVASENGMEFNFKDLKIYPI